jgi:hypothetical protein
LHGFGDTVGAALMLDGGQDALRPERFGGGNDFFVVGGYYDLLGQFCLAGLLVGVLDEEFTCIFGENLTGQSCRTVSSRYNSNNFHLGLYVDINVFFD